MRRWIRDWHHRQVLQPPHPDRPQHLHHGSGMYSSFPVEVTVGGSTIFVLNVDRFEKV